MPFSVKLEMKNPDSSTRTLVSILPDSATLEMAWKFFEKKIEAYPESVWGPPKVVSFDGLKRGRTDADFPKFSRIEEAIIRSILLAIGFFVGIGATIFVFTGRWIISSIGL